MDEVVEQFKKLMKAYSFLDKYKGIEINSREDIKKIPLSDRNDLVDYDISMCPERPVEVFGTSGTTNKRSLSFISKEALKQMIERTERIFEILNIKRKVFLSLITYGNISSVPYIVESAAIKKENSFVSLSLAKKEELKRTANKVKPEAIICYTNEMFSVLKMMQNTKFLKKIFVGGEPVLNEHYRFVNSFGDVNLHSLYGTSEVSTMAVQLNPKDKRHLILDGIYTEVLKKDNEVSEYGEGELLITDLYNFSTPIIRYRVGDWVKIEKKGNKKYLTIYGRTGDVINLHGELVSKVMLVEKTMNVLHHPEFFFVVVKDKKTFDDIIRLNILKEDFDKEKELYEKLEPIIGKFKVVATKLKAPRGNTGKVINFIDLRGKELEKKGLSF